MGVRSDKIPALTGLRFLAAMLVFVGHAPNNLGLDSGRQAHLFAIPALSHRTTGVGLFFALSGFVITFSYADRLLSGRESTKSYLLRRLARLWPVYVIVTTLIVPIGILRHQAWGYLVLQYLGLQSWWPTIEAWHSWNGVAWSLSTEAFFYVAFPFALLRLLRRLNSPRQVLLAWAACWIGLLATYFVRTHLQHHGGNDWLLYVFPPLRFLEFSMGALAGWLFLQRRGKPLPSRLGAVAAGLLVLELLTLKGAEDKPWHYALLVIPLMSPTIYWLAASSGAISRLLATKTLVRFGDWSYAFYLTHALVFYLVGNAVRPHLSLEGPTHILFAVGLSFVLATAFSALLHHAVELPAQRRLQEHWGLTRRLAITPTDPPAQAVALAAGNSEGRP